MLACHRSLSIKGQYCNPSHRHCFKFIKDTRTYIGLSASRAEVLEAAVEPGARLLLVGRLGGLRSLRLVHSQGLAASGCSCSELFVFLVWTSVLILVPQLLALLISMPATFNVDDETVQTDLVRSLPCSAPADYLEHLDR
jgi:hypothetical protein